MLHVDPVFRLIGTTLHSANVLLEWLLTYSIHSTLLIGALLLLTSTSFGRTALEPKAGLGARPERPLKCLADRTCPTANERQARIEGVRRDDLAQLRDALLREPDQHVRAVRLGGAGGEDHGSLRGDRVGVLAVRGHDRALAPRVPHQREQVLVGEVQRALVGEEDFERADPAPHDFAQLRQHPAPVGGDFVESAAPLVAIGPDGNILKLRPPMVLTRDDADLFLGILVDTLGRTLAAL